MSAEGTIEIIGNNLQIAATEYVEIKGKKVCVNGGCEGEKEGKAAKTTSSATHDEAFVLKFDDGTILANHNYKLIASSGEVLEGVSDENGQTERIGTAEGANVQIIVLGKAE